MHLSFLGVTVVRVLIPPELMNEEALITYLGTSEDELKKIWWFRKRMYHQFKIPKGKDSTRIISAPDKRLKYLQRKIVLLLEQLYRVRKPVHGFVTEKSVKTNALSHLRKHFVLNIDLKNFFPSITEKRVIGVLKSLGIKSPVAKIIARLCCYNAHLPQGAPTSPILSNMICFRLDKQLLAFAKRSRCIYTRYADDITFSSNVPMTALFEGAIPLAGHFNPDLLASTLCKIIDNNGFIINPKKAHYADRHSRRMVTGLKVNELLNVDRRYIRNIRATLHSIKILGKNGAQEKYKNNYGGASDIGQHLEGKITWLRYIRGRSDPVFRSLAVRFNDSFPERRIMVMPTADEILDRTVWVIEHEEGQLAQGSAFFLKDIGLVTAAHCIEEFMKSENKNKKIIMYHWSKPSNKFYPTVLKYDKDRDLALLSFSIPETEYFELEQSTQDVTVGDEVIAVGYPDFGPGDRLSIRRGTASSFPIKHCVQQIEVTQMLSPGMSGGPILDCNNTVVGVIHKGGPGEGRNIAIRIDMLNALLDE